MRIRIAAAALAAASTALSVASMSAAGGDTMQIDGFTVETAQVGADKVERMRPSLERQMEIVDQAGVPPDVLAFFKSVPIVMVRDLDSGFGHANRDETGRQIVELKAAKLPGDRPILLHELLHAYHGVVLGPTPQIRDAYRQAAQSPVYQQYAKAHFLENPQEYFAVIGSIFLTGEKIDQPPYDCGIPARYQPQFIAFLTEKFGPHRCE